MRMSRVLRKKWTRLSPERRPEEPLATLLENDPNPDARPHAVATARDQCGWDHG